MSGWDNVSKFEKNLTKSQYDTLYLWCLNKVKLAIPSTAFTNISTSINMPTYINFYFTEGACGFTIFTKKKGHFVYHTGMMYTVDEWINYIQPILKWCWNNIDQNTLVYDHE